MGLVTTAKKLQTVTEMAEKLYTKVDELRTQVSEVKTHVEATSQRVERVERELDEQRAVLDAIAQEQGVDVDEQVAEATIREAEPDHEVANADASTGDGVRVNESGTDESGAGESDTNRRDADDTAEASQ